MLATLYIIWSDISFIYAMIILYYISIYFLLSEGYWKFIYADAAQ